MYNCDKINAELIRHNRFDVTCLNEKRKVGDSYEFRFMCNKCHNTDWWAYPKYILRQNYRCLKCYENQPDKYIIKHGRAIRINRGLSEEQVIEKVRKVRDDMELIHYAGSTHKLSTWKCKNCGAIKHDTVGHITGSPSYPMAYCNSCHSSAKKIYQVYNNTFDSSWETHFFLHHIYAHHPIVRLQKEIPFPYFFNWSIHTWYPDFFLYPHIDLLIEYPYIYDTGGIIIEIKPESFSYEKEKTEAKKQSGFPVVWIGKEEIKYMQQENKKRNIDIEQYRIK